MSKTSFRTSREIGPVFTSGPVALSSDGTSLVGCVNEEPRSTSLLSGSTTGVYQTDSSGVTSLTISPNNAHLAIFTSSLSLRLYPLASSSDASSNIHPIKHIPRAHDAPVHVSTIDPTSTLIASGSADGIVKVHDIRRGHLTHLFRGHGGIVSALKFFYKAGSTAGTWDTMWLVSASADSRVRVYDLAAAGTGSPIMTLEGHVSVPRGVGVSNDGRYVISGGRDSVVLIWDTRPPIENGKPDKGGKKGKKSSLAPVLVKTIPVLERIEALSVLEPEDSGGKLRFYTGGQKGVIKVWDAWDTKVLQTFGEEVESSASLEDDGEESRQILDVLYTPSTHALSSVHADQNVLTFSLNTGTKTRQLIGYNDEVIDAVFLSIYPTPDVHTPDASKNGLLNPLNASLLSGHTDIVLALSAAPNGWLASAGKDREVRIWSPVRAPLQETDDETAMDEDDKPAENDHIEWTCVAMCAGHAESIGAVAFGGLDANGVPSFLVTGSQDRTLKVWDLSVLRGSTPPAPIKLKSLTTAKAHDKDINALDVAPNGRLVATGSQDKTAKVFELGTSHDLTPIGTLKGHKRGVWSVRFSPVERVIATGSGDKTVKLWSLDDWACLKTFEGHTNSILRLSFLTHGTQLVSAGSDGLVKLWTVRTEECVATLDAHEDKVWALSVSADERTIVSAAADSRVVVWRDSTEEEQLEKEEQRAKGVELEQNFTNYLALNDYRNAILLALTMDQPGRLYNLFKSVRATRPTKSITSRGQDTEPTNTITGSAEVDQVLATLPGSDLVRLLGHIRTWNASARTSTVAQTVLHAVLSTRTTEDIISAFDQDKGLPAEFGGKAKPGTDLRSIVDGLVPYTERHLSRAERLVQDSFVVDYVLSEMDMGITLGGMDAMEVS
ncbi:U3 small nucleolar RNA-associated protein 13 [Rhizoctonia solani]|uniref:U3 small nucleolar RNA-associated protein 13 n=1 Tax=Rhizoctonia solani TaxID=456999 RepID=A0A0K6G2I6_9AGAM|nr:U3 small nucleolar RNA-associated protein 13 [Rhizoctonia solani]